MTSILQYLTSLPHFEYAVQFYNKVLDESDIRTSNWPLVSSPYYPLGIVAFYLYVALHGGPMLMRKKKTPNISKVLMVYNAGVLVLNAVMGIALTYHIYTAKYRFSCQRVRIRGKHETRIAELLWIFYISKILELSDTLFLIIKKKESQLTFLHVYHHSTIVIATYIGVKFAPGGSTAIIAMVNSWVHVFMYLYYEMMALGIKQFLGWKKFVTIMQIVQFVGTIIHCSTALKSDCQYPRWILNWLLLYMISFLILFIKFYIDTYYKKPNEMITQQDDEEEATTTSTDTDKESLLGCETDSSSTDDLD